MFLHSCVSNEQGIHTRGSYQISTGSVFLNLVQSLQSNIVHPKIFLSDRIQRSYCKILTPYCACRNADSNLILVAAMTNTGFIFQLSDSLMVSWGICLTRLDCNWPRTFLDTSWLPPRSLDSSYGDQNSKSYTVHCLKCVEALQQQLF